MAGPKLKTVTRTQGNNRALKDGSVKPRTFEFDFVEVDPLIAAFRRMVRGNEFDICEMAITTYICAKRARQADDGRAGVPGARLSPRRDPGQHQVRHPHAQGPRRPKGRRQPRLHGDHRGVGARHSAGRVRRRPEQDHLGALRRRARGGVPAARQRGADRARARRWTTCWRPASLPPPSASRRTRRT